MFNNVIDYSLVKLRSKMLFITDCNRYINSMKNDLINNPKRFWKYASIKKQQVVKSIRDILWRQVCPWCH